VTGIATHDVKELDGRQTQSEIWLKLNYMSQNYWWFCTFLQRYVTLWLWSWPLTP